MICEKESPRPRRPSQGHYSRVFTRTKNHVPIDSRTALLLQLITHFLLLYRFDLRNRAGPMPEVFQKLTINETHFPRAYRISGRTLSLKGSRFYTGFDVASPAYGCARP